MGAMPDNVHKLVGKAPDDISYAVEAARNAVEQEFQISQRLDTKIQYQFAVTAGWFAVAQTVAALVLNKSGMGQVGIVLVLIAGMLAVGALSWAIFKNVRGLAIAPGSRHRSGEAQTVGR